MAGSGVLNERLEGEVFLEGALRVAGDVPALFHIRYCSIKTKPSYFICCQLGQGDTDIGGQEWINLFLENDTAHVFVIIRLVTVRSCSFALQIFPKAT